MSSLSESVNLGHQHPALIRAIREQAEKLCFTTAAWGAEPRARLAERLLELSGFEGGRVFFSLGGADANENAVKFARQAGSQTEADGSSPGTAPITARPMAPWRSPATPAPATRSTLRTCGCSTSLHPTPIGVPSTPRPKQNVAKPALGTSVR